MNKVSAKKKLFQMNEPKILVLVGGLGSAILGISQPVYGLIIGRFMTMLSVPISSVGGPEALRDKVATEAIYTTIIALIAYFATMV